MAGQNPNELIPPLVLVMPEHMRSLLDLVAEAVNVRSMMMAVGNLMLKLAHDRTLIRRKRLFIHL